MAAGLGLLRLEPGAFWAMTPKEIEAAFRGLLGASRLDAPLARDELAGLMRRYPDITLASSSTAGGANEKEHP